MKQSLILLMVLLIATFGFSREQTLLVGNVDHGGYGGPAFKIAQIGPNNSNAVLAGGQGGWIIDHKFIIGGGGYGLTTDVRADWIDFRTFDGEPQPHYLNFGYGGLLLGFIPNSDDLVHYEIYGLFGGGAVDYRIKDAEQSYDSSDGIFVAEPGINIMVNVTPFFRIGAGASYRYVSGLNDDVLTNEDLSGISGQIIFKFGSF
jgi:hypothetical protein